MEFRSAVLGEDRLTCTICDMSTVHSAGPFFAHTMKYPSTRHPMIERGSTQEVTWPFRQGVSVVIRVPMTRLAVSLGYWRANSEQDEHVALMRALGGRELGDLKTWRG